MVSISILEHAIADVRIEIAEMFISGLGFLSG
jgi:hypothetical protein